MEKTFDVDGSGVDLTLFGDGPGFAKYRCTSCNRWWKSANGFESTGQECKNCKNMVQHYEIQRLFYYLCPNNDCQDFRTYGFDMELVCSKCTQPGLIRFETRKDRKIFMEANADPTDDLEPKKKYSDLDKPHRSDLCQRCILLSPMKCRDLEVLSIWRLLEEKGVPLPTKFPGILLGEDEFGYLYVQNEAEKENFMKMKDEIQAYYGNEKRQDLHRIVNPEVLAQKGTILIVFIDQLNRFIRGRLEKVFKMENEGCMFCVVFDIDDGEYHTVPRYDVYVSHKQFLKLHPQSSMVVLEGTEEVMLSKDLAENMLLAFDSMDNQAVKVTVVESHHPIFKVPSVKIETEFGDFCDILHGITPGFVSLPKLAITDQEEIITKLESRCYIITSK